METQATVRDRSNVVYLRGIIDREVQYGYEANGEKFYEFFLLVPRLSCQSDRLQVTISERSMINVDLSRGTNIAFNGQFRSYNKPNGEKSKLMLTVFLLNFASLDEEIYNPNQIELSGYICRPPIYRITPSGREICDIFLAVNRAYGKSDYIPCIVWGRNANYIKEFNVGRRISIAGRIQSREYNKTLHDGTVEQRVAYEVSVSKICFEEESDAKND